MGFHIQLDLKAIEQAPGASGAEGIDLRVHLGGLALMYHHVWAKKSDHATRELLMGWFAVGPEQLPRLVAGLVAFGHLEARTMGWRIKGSGRYSNLRQALSKGGKKSAGNLRQFSGRGAQQGPSSEEPDGGRPVPVEKPSSGPGKTRAPSDQEICWIILEKLRVDRCTELGLQPGECPAPKLCNSKLHKAVEAVGLVDRVDAGGAFTRWDTLSLLFERYLAQDRIGLVDREGKPCVPPYPIGLFLSPGVLRRFLEEYEEEQAA